MRRILDLFSGAGGACAGYQRAGFWVRGVDIKNQPRYCGEEFVQADALEYLNELIESGEIREFDAIHASPPCQAHTALKKMWNAKQHEDLIPQTRAALIASGLPFVMENVPGAPMEGAFLLCGTMFGLRTACGAELQRHRYFECNFWPGLLPQCRHGWAGVVGVYGGHVRDRRRTITVTGNTPQQNVVRNTARKTFSVQDAQQAMGIDWMPMNALSQAIPPAYTEFIGRQLMQAIEANGK
jgi:DNA (cytosine-5)-methyltransferase 1